MPRISTAEFKAVQARKPLPRRERDIQAAILEYLKTRPDVVAWRQNTGAMFGNHKGKARAVRFGFPGLSDIIGWRVVNRTSPAVPLAIEVKCPGKEPTREQQAFLDLVRRDGGIAIVARSIEDVMTVLSERPAVEAGRPHDDYRLVCR